MILFVTRTPVTKVSRILGQQASSSSRSNGQTLLINRLHLYRPARTQHRLWLTEYLCSINHPTGNPPRNLHIIHHIQGRTLRQVRLVNTLPAGLLISWPQPHRCRDHIPPYITRLNRAHQRRWHPLRLMINMGEAFLLSRLQWHRRCTVTHRTAL